MIYKPQRTPQQRHKGLLTVASVSDPGKQHMPDTHQQSTLCSIWDVMAITESHGVCHRSQLALGEVIKKHYVLLHLLQITLRNM